jgi:hypothetical protein
MGKGFARFFSTSQYAPSEGYPLHKSLGGLLGRLSLRQCAKAATARLRFLLGASPIPSVCSAAWRHGTTDNLAAPLSKLF